MVRKILAWPFDFIGGVVAITGLFMVSVSDVISGTPMKEVIASIKKGTRAIEGALGCDDAIIEMVERNHGSGKAMQVAEILEQGE